MDYFIQQGYPDAAQKFAQEANVDFKADDTLMDERVSIREAIYQGDIERAIDEINSIDVQVGFHSFLRRRYELHDDPGFSCTTHSLRVLMIANTNFSPQSDLFWSFLIV